VNRAASIAAALLFTTSVGAGAAAEEGTSAAERIVQEQVEAYNRHDLDGFLRFYSDTIQIYGFPDKLTTSGLEEMRVRYAKLFGDAPNVHAKITQRIVRGDFVIDSEEVTGLRDGNVVNAVAIYEVRDGRIQKVWFIR